MNKSTNAQTKSTGARPLLAELLVTSRPVSWVNTAFPFAAAYILTTGTVDWRFILGTLYFLIPYNFAMYGINDVFDYESDILNPRKGGTEGAVLDRRLHRTTLLAVLATNVPFLAYLVITGTWSSTAVLALSVFAVIAYSAPGLRLKERPFIDSATSSFHFVSPAVFGLAYSGATYTPALIGVLGAFFLWGMASHAFGAVQDIVSDRAGNVGSVGTVLGAKTTVWLSFAAYGLASVLMLPAGWPAALAALLALPYMANVWPYRTVTDDASGRAHAGWQRFLWLNYLTGFLVTMLLIWYAAVR
ncbi:prenyltransferase [Arthrobacter sp. H14]|uniref:prenyltransferase n=1 Tax=Arthrobacter sp. H14 TaxID=1312959 RepID=UPI0004B91A2B|nr:prenyltransferase [Arthrobacter sp. H14]